MKNSSRIAVVVSALMLCGMSGTKPQPQPPAPREQYPVLDHLDYADNAAARTAWRAVENTAASETVPVGDRRVLKLPCNFKGTSIQRAYWDHDVNLDLIPCRGIRFRLYCPDTSPVSGFNLYLRSGEGWYTARFEPETESGWSDVRIYKADTRWEGRPAGWGRIDRIRIAAWRGGHTDTVLYVADLGTMKQTSPVALIRAESVSRSPSTETYSVLNFTKTVSEHLRHRAVPYVMLSDLDISPITLRDKKVVILPHNPEMPARAESLLVDFLARGGKMVSFYTLPSRLQEPAGIRFGKLVHQAYPGHFATIRPVPGKIEGFPPLVRQLSWNVLQARPAAGRSTVAAYWFNDKGKNTGEPAILLSDRAVHMTHVVISDDPGGKRAMLLAMIGHFLPEAWPLATRKSIDDVGRLGSYRGFDQAVASIRKLRASGRAVGRILDNSTRQRNDAIQLFKKQQFPAAIRAAIDARDGMVRAYCTAQTPLAGEHRAFWCHNAFGVEGMTWDQSIQVLADNGFTAILPNMLWGGLAYYDSKVLPVSKLVESKGDQVAQCLRACKRYGVECHVWKVCWNMASRAPDAFVAQAKREGRVQVSFSGKAEDRWLCPTHPANRKLEIDALLEIVRKYPVHGIHLDYIRFPSSQHCFCAGCRARFEAYAGVKVRNWPGDIRRQRSLEARWQEFRRDAITRVVAEVSRRARAIRPGIKISAAVFTNWPMDRDNIGQDWKTWCDRGYLDFVCPMDYSANNTQFLNLVRRQKSWAGRVPCYPGIGLSTWSDRGNPVRLVDQINVTRQLKTDGFTVFQYRENEARKVVPLCGEGITKR